jgi:hypothetical protein
MPTGTDEGRERARQIRIEANRLRDRRRRRNRLIGLGVLAVLAVGTATAVWLLSGDEAEPPSDDSAGDSSDLFDEARAVVAETGSVISFGEILGPDVLVHADVLSSAGEYESYVVRGADLAAANPAALTLLLDRLGSLTRVEVDDPRLEVAPTVSDGDIGIAVQRVDDAVISLVAVCDDPDVRAAYP